MEERAEPPHVDGPYSPETYDNLINAEIMVPHGDGHITGGDGLLKTPATIPQEDTNPCQDYLTTKINIMASEKCKLSYRHCAELRNTRLHVEKLRHETEKLQELATKVPRKRKAKARVPGKGKANCDHDGLPESIAHDFLGERRMCKCTVPKLITLNLRYLLRELDPSYHQPEELPKGGIFR